MTKEFKELITRIKREPKYDTKRRRTKEVKSKKLELRIDEAFEKKLESCVRETGLSKSEVIRQHFMKDKIVVFPNADKLVNTLLTIAHSQEYLFNMNGQSNYEAKCGKFYEAKKILDDAGKAVLAYMEQQIKEDKIIGVSGNGNTESSK